MSIAAIATGALCSRAALPTVESGGPVRHRIGRHARPCARRASHSSARRAAPAVEPRRRKVERDCRTIALAGNPRGDLSELALQSRSDGLVDIMVAGKSDILTGADECSLQGPADDFSLDCEWELPSQGAALTRFNYLKVKLSPSASARK